MRLILKLTAAIALGLIAVLVVSGVIRIQRDLAAHRRDVARDDVLMGRTIAGAVERTWRDAGRVPALDLIRHANERESDVQIRAVLLDAPPAPESALGPPADPAAVQRARTRRRPVSVVHDGIDGGEPVSISYVPMDVPSGEPMAIELRETLRQRAVVRATLRDLAFTSIGLALVLGVLAFALSVVLVARPMRSLVAQARAIGQGTPVPRLAMQQRDEIGDLARQMNAMCDQLDEARRRLADETHRRMEALEQLRHADRLLTVGKLAAGIAHEMGTPLNVVIGYADLIRQEQPAGTASHGHATQIAEQATKMADVIRQLLEFARPRPPERFLQDLAPVVRRAVALVDGIARRSRADVTVAVQEVPASVDAGQLEQALTNILVNAFQALGARGGRVAVSLDRVAQVMPDGGERPYARITVTDDGIGMTDEVRTRAFEPFFTTKGVGEGTGLGLSVTYGIVREHGGWIDVETEPGRGTTFRVYLPAEEP